MSFVTYVATVAVVNLLLGAVVAVITADSVLAAVDEMRSHRHRRHCFVPGPTEARERTDPGLAATARVPDEQQQSARPADDGGRVQPVAPTSAEHDPAEQTVGTDGNTLLEGSWADIATVVLKLADDCHSLLCNAQGRLQDFDRQPTDEAFREIIAQARSATDAWLANSQSTTERLLPAVRKLPDGRNIASRCESMLFQQAAQSETSVSNLSMMERATDVAATRSRLGEELQRLIDSLCEMRIKLQQLIDVVYQSRQAS